MPTTTLSTEDCDELRELVLDRGLAAVAEDASLSEEAVIRAMSGLPIKAGTKRLLEDILDEDNDESEGADSDPDRLDDEDED
jgi:hypothetical protein